MTIFNRNVYSIFNKRRHNLEFLYKSTSCGCLKRRKCTGIRDTYIPNPPEYVARYGDLKRHTFDGNETVYSKNNIFSIILPPPNITGTLHLGHALTATLQDVLCRWRRMNGSRVCWVPGTDHAGIATQVVVEKFLEKNGLGRSQLGYQQFQSELNNWKERNQSIIYDQLKRLNLTLDWSKETFTMDPRHSYAVNEAFMRLFNEGLIYRRDYLVNWSCSLNSTISDIEVVNVEIDGPTDFNIPNYTKPVRVGEIYEIAYKFSEGPREEIVVATTRPETLLGDVAIAVHPEDSRYSDAIGSRLEHPFLKKTIPLIADPSVDVDFGTGAVKITPAHDRNDYDIGLKHSLEAISVIDERGSIKDGFGTYSGMKRYDARSAIVKDLQCLGLLRNVRPHKMVVPMCSRSADIVELRICPQWYLNCKDMSRIALDAVKCGDLKLIPREFENVWYDWLENPQDWCISRQLWWGHRIPVYKCFSPDDPDSFIWIAEHDEVKAKNKAKAQIKSSEITCQPDNDVLDTWFSSAIYPFSSHGWPNNTPNFKKLYPLSVLVTGHDILRFWVYKMVMLGTKLTGKLPFDKVLLHGIVCDSLGAKMSKSKGNVIDPRDVVEGISLDDLNNRVESSYKNGILNKKELDVSLVTMKKQYPKGIPRCGTDALRFTLCTPNAQNLYINFDVEDCESNLHFCNKIWQCVKYSNMIQGKLSKEAIANCTKDDLDTIDRWILSRLTVLIATTFNAMENFNFHTATIALRQFLYKEMCDVYIELTKMNHKTKVNEKKLAANCHTFSTTLNSSLRLISPFMPQLAEELLHHVPLSNNCIFNFQDSIENLTVPEEKNYSEWFNESLENDFEIISSIVSTIRQLKNTHKITKGMTFDVHIESCDGEVNRSSLSYEDLIRFSTSCERILLIENNKMTPSDIWSYSNDKNLRVYLKTLSEKIQKKSTTNSSKDFLKKRERMKNNLEKLERMVAADGFSKAPKEVQISHRNKINALREELDRIEAVIKN